MEEHSHTSKPYIVLSIIVVAAVVFFIFWSRNHPQPVVTNDATPVDVSPWPSLETKREKIDQSTAQYSITAQYPIVKDAGITLKFKQFVDTQIAQFKSDTAWATDPTIAPAEAQELSIDINYKEEKSSIADTYVFSIATYTGGAHGLMVTQTFAYSPIGKLISVDDLFTNGAKGLETVSTYVQKELGTREFADASWIADGAAPKEDNYQSFVVQDEGVTFIFDPYQVAPYAAGSQSVTVPLSVFKSIANPAIFTR